MSHDGHGSPSTHLVLVKVAAITFLFLTTTVLVAGTDLQSEEEVIRLGEQTEVTIHLNYSELTSEQVSVLIPPAHTPQDLRARDGNGQISCEYNDVDSEILCDPGAYNTTYNVTIRYTTANDLVQENGYYAFSHTQRILIPTERYSLTVILPEGYGLVEEEEDPISPDYGDEGSAEGGRQFAVTWEKDDLELGEVERYELKYQELRVFEDIIPSHFSFLAALFIVLITLVLYLYVRRRREEGETIASIMPVLKDDEREALRYIIDQGGDCEQKELVENLEYSKAKISRLVKDLEERNLIEKIKEGRKNRLILAKEIGNIEMEEDE